MFLLSKPTESKIQAVLAQQREQDFSYVGAGASNSDPPDGYAVLRARVELGRGRPAFEAAVEAMRQWKMFSVPGVRLCWPNVPIQAGCVVAVVVRHFGFWSLNCCRIIYVLDEEGPIRRFGFAYGTLPEHAEKGEERFTIEWNRNSGRVEYDILSFSRPGSIWTFLAYPAGRWLQRRFVQESLKAMVNAVRT
jgi:uncharacterized protein (UPF0548 family)